MAKAKRSRFSRSRRDRPSALAASFGGFAVIACLAATVGGFVSFPPKSSPFIRVSHIGHIFLTHDFDKCEELLFDNDSGLIVPTNEVCYEPRIVEAEDTEDRVSTIQRSFSKR
jgi:hypothetical protein